VGYVTLAYARKVDLVMATKAEQIVDHFVPDPAIKAHILSTIADMKGNPDARDVDKIIARYTDDPVLTAKIKEIIGKVAAGHSMHAIAGYHISDPATAVRASHAISGHRAVVEHILKS
jgi:ketosteroid isomerase-like protein